MLIFSRLSWHKDESSLIQDSSLCGGTNTCSIITFWCCSLHIITVFWVSSLITTEIEFVNPDRLTITRFLDIQNNMTSDSTIQSITTKHFSEVSAGNSQFHISIHVGIICTAVDNRNQCSILTAQDDIHVTIDIGILTCTDQFINLYRTICQSAWTGINRNITSDGTLLVTTTISLMNKATLQQGVCIAIDIGTRIDIPCGTTIKGIIVSTITTAKHLFNLMGTQY